MHGIHTTKPNHRGAQWAFDGNLQAPTFSPSIHIWDERDKEGKPLPDGQRRTICHYFINAGQIQFCGDSDHALAGQTVSIPELPECLQDFERRIEPS